METKQLVGFAGLIGLVAVLAMPLSTLAVANYITLPEGFVTNALAYAGQLFTDTSLLIILAIGLPLAFWVIKKVISLVRVR